MMGALLATAAIFLPSVIFVLMGTPLLRRVRRHEAAAIPFTRTSLQADQPLTRLILLVLFGAALLLNRWLKPSRLVLPGLGLGLVVALVGRDQISLMPRNSLNMTTAPARPAPTKIR